VDVAILVAHEIQLAGGNGNRLGADAEKAADVDDDLAAVQMIDRTDLLVVRAIDGGAFEYIRRQFRAGKSCVVGVIHDRSPLGWIIS